MAVRKKIRCRRVDPLKDVFNCITNAKSDLKEFQLQLSDNRTRKLFVERIQEKRVPKDCSPLVLTILSNRYDAFKYILDNFGANIEQETSAVIEGGHRPADGATPLWTAATTGRLEFVKELVKRGADIEHTTDSQSSPLRGAAYDGHCDVCEYLIDCGADIDKPNHVGQSPLTIAAAMERLDCVRLLISKKADVYHRGLNGDTPLHVSVESGGLDVARVLVAAGAKNIPNDLGFTPAILASCYGYDEIMEYLNITFSLKPLELYNCYCLLASRAILHRQYEKAEERLLGAVVLRMKHAKIFTDLPQAHSLYDGLQEPATVAEVRHVLQDSTLLYFLSSIISERILGKLHPTTAFCIRISGDMVLPQGQHGKCMALWLRSLEFDEAPRVAYELQIISDLLFFVRGFSIMSSKGFVGSVEPLFRWGMKEVLLARQSKIADADIVCCLSRMLAVWIKTAAGIRNSQEKGKELQTISTTVSDFVRLTQGLSCPVLNACLRNLPGKPTGAHTHILTAQLPLHEALIALIDHGCSVHCEDEDGNFPLHLAAQLKEDSALNCVKTLLEYGAHPDIVNFDGHTALELARKHGNELIRGDVVPVMEAAMVQLSTLQCLASRALVKYGIDYAAVLPKYLVQFVSLHEC